MKNHCLKEVIQIIPNVKDLLANRILKCTQENCLTTFTNLSNLQMHLDKHHKIKGKMRGSDESNKIKLYFCPEINCIYNEETTGGKYFASLKYVRQHYQKVHAEKNFKCEKCEKRFITNGALNAHTKNCGKKYKCADCGWEYNCREALLTHAKRKAHKVLSEDTKPRTTKKDDDKDTTAESIFVQICAELEDKGVQTDSTAAAPSNSPVRKTLSKRKIAIQQDEPVFKREKLSSEPKSPGSDYTEKQKNQSHLEFDIFEETGADRENNKKNLNNLCYGDDTMNSCFDQLVNSSSFCHIETQTEFSSTILDQLLYSDTHTQTCDEFLSELGLSDIQTQTNWSGIPDSTGRSCNVIESASGAHDELLVSTETQTSFTQCLLECNGLSTPGITQHTQTCDTLLEGLFGAQENDLIGTFQSTHTQT